MSGKPRRGHDVSRNVNEEEVNGRIDLLGGESLGEEMQRNDEGRVGTPVGEMKGNLLSVQNLLLARALHRESRRDPLLPYAENEAHPFNLDACFNQFSICASSI